MSDNRDISPALSDNRGFSPSDAPVLNHGPYNPLVVVINSPVTLSCVPDANPPVNTAVNPIVWTKNNVTVGQQALLSSILDIEFWTVKILLNKRLIDEGLNLVN